VHTDVASAGAVVVGAEGKGTGRVAVGHPASQRRTPGKGFGGEIPDKRVLRREGETDWWAIAAPGPHMAAARRGREMGAGRLRYRLGRRGEFGP
jgi:hypothetical protein